MTNEKKTILIAEDSEPMRIIIKRILQKDFPQFQIESFEDGTSLESRLNKEINDVALVVTDNRMPGITGFEIIKKYAKKLEYSGVKFILCYLGDEKIGKIAIENGAFDYILKMEMIKYSKIVKKALNL
jgi:DNA-binding NtrC family response regulator